MSAAVQQISSLSSPPPALPLPESLTAVQVRVVASLARGATVTSAAAEAGVHRTTIYHWLRTSKDFRQAVEAAKADFTAELADRLRDLSTAAVATLEKLLHDPDVPAGVRLKTALAVLQRPQYPQTSWTLPESVLAPREQELADAYAEIQAEENEFRAIDKVRHARHAPVAAQSRRDAESRAALEIPRNAPCPCGSGEKYKRCCGRNAPPVLSCG